MVFLNINKAFFFFFVVLQASSVVLLPPLAHLLTKTPENLKQNLEQALFCQLCSTLSLQLQHLPGQKILTHTNINFYLTLVSLAIFPVYQNQSDSSPRNYKDEDSLMMMHSPASPQVTPWSSLQKYFMGFRHTRFTTQQLIIIRPVACEILEITQFPDEYFWLTCNMNNTFAKWRSLLKITTSMILHIPISWKVCYNNKCPKKG